MPFEPGTLTAVARDPGGREAGRSELVTAGSDRRLLVRADQSALAAGGQDIAFVEVVVVDVTGIVHPATGVELVVEVDGAGTLAGFGGANPIPVDGHTDGRHETYYGRAPAAVRAGFEPGEVRVRVSAPGMESASPAVVVTEST